MNNSSIRKYSIISLIVLTCIIASVVKTAPEFLAVFLLVSFVSLTAYITFRLLKALHRTMSTVGSYVYLLNIFSAPSSSRIDRAYKGNVVGKRTKKNGKKVYVVQIER